MRGDEAEYTKYQFTPSVVNTELALGRYGVLSY